jgi:hypothetical protein
LILLALVGVVATVRSARFVTVASARINCYSTPPRTGSDSAANETSQRAAKVRPRK